MDITTVRVGELTEGDKLIVEGSAAVIVDLGKYDHANQTVTGLKYEDPETGEEKEINLKGEVEIEEITCRHISGRSWEYPGDYCENRVQGDSEFCGYHNEW